MTREIGAREKALRQQTEDRYNAEQARQKADRQMLDTIKKLRGDVAVASQKRGKPRKKK